MKIYTKTGDNGTTALIGGRRVPKNHIRIEAYGTIDELISFAGLIGAFQLPDEINQTILQIQDRLMVTASQVATDINYFNERLPQLTISDIEFLEAGIDQMETKLNPLTCFIIPAGNQPVMYCHVCRTICRRAERIVLNLNESEKVPELVLQYLNRLSDYFFVLARYLSFIFQLSEKHWQPE